MLLYVFFVLHCRRHDNPVSGRRCTYGVLYDSGFWAHFVRQWLNYGCLVQEQVFVLDVYLVALINVCVLSCGMNTYFMYSLETV
jgi:hypothetical protein